MREKTITIYEFSELSERAKRAALNEYCDSTEYYWADENLQTLTAFAKLFHVKVLDWEYGSGNSNKVSFIMVEEEEIIRLKGIRLLRFITNNYGTRLFRQKYLGQIKNKSMYSHVQSETSCVLTGYCIDDSILQPMYDFLKRPKNIDLNQLIENCLQSWCAACNSDCEYQFSMSGFAECCELNGYEFDISGNKI